MKPQKTPPAPYFEPFVRPSSVASLRNELRASLPDVDQFELVGAPAGQSTTLPRTIATDENRTITTDENGFRKIIYDSVAYDYLEDDDEEADETSGDDDTPWYQYNNDGAFNICSGTDWLAQNDDTMPPEAMLFGSLWMQHELCILFADTNTGKSVLAVQIADSVSRGLPIPGMALTAAPGPVLYFDFELSEQQFRSRYSATGQGKYPFTANFHRVTLNPYSNKQKKFATYEEFINNEIENALLGCKAKTLIIDNITCLRYGTQNAAGAYNLMHYLQAIKRRYQVSILVLAHTPKRNPAKPLSRNDLQGSKMLLNLADSAFAIGESLRQPGLRYLKQIKQRSACETHGAENVCLGSIHRTGSFLHFTFNGHSHESDHLAPQTEQYRRSTEHRVRQLNQQGQSLRKIANQLGLASTTVFRILKRLERCGEEEQCADVQMRECADGERCADIQVNKPMDNNQYADLQLRATEEKQKNGHLSQPAAHPLSAQRREGRPAERGRGESSSPCLETQPNPLTSHEPNTHDDQQARVLCNSNVIAAHPLSAQRREIRPAERGRGESSPPCPETQPKPPTPHETKTPEDHNPQKNCHPEALEGRPKPLTPYEAKTREEHPLSATPPITNDVMTNDYSTIRQTIIMHIPIYQKPQKIPKPKKLPITQRYAGVHEALAAQADLLRARGIDPYGKSAEPVNSSIPDGFSLSINEEIEGLTYLAKYEPMFFKPEDKARLQLLMEQAGDGSPGS
ncbi:MAG: AAA family ATPase [Mucilaginibacter sp.]